MRTVVVDRMERIVHIFPRPRSSSIRLEGSTNHVNQNTSLNLRNEPLSFTGRNEEEAENAVVAIKSECKPLGRFPWFYTTTDNDCLLLPPSFPPLPLVLSRLVRTTGRFCSLCARELVSFGSRGSCATIVAEVLFDSSSRIALSHLVVHYRLFSEYFLIIISFGRIKL